jgi:small subunit ribosomal protein S17
MAETIIKNKRKLEGVVVSDKMSKTRVVSIERLKLHAKYRKYEKVSTRFKAHDENNEYKVGDHVVIEETRPMSRDKRWIIIRKIDQTSK